MANQKQHRFGLIGVGFIAPRHLRAIKETDNKLVAALDPHDSVGVLDTYFPAARFFVNPKEFWDYVSEQREQGMPVSMVSICSPNDLHEDHIHTAMEHGASVICEKPAVIEPAAIGRLQKVEQQTGHQVNIVLQLRLHPKLRALRERTVHGHHNVDLRYITPRGPWYDISWKGNAKRSGGMAVNIGIHLFDTLIWLFGSVQNITVEEDTGRRLQGTLQLERATVRWFLSINAEDLRTEDKGRCRRMVVDEETTDFTVGFEDLHTHVYQNILAGNGFTLQDALPAIEVTEYIRKISPHKP